MRRRRPLCHVMIASVAGLLFAVCRRRKGLVGADSWQIGCGVSIMIITITLTMMMKLHERKYCESVF